MSQSSPSKKPNTPIRPIMDLEPVRDLYYSRYQHKNEAMQKSDILLYGLLIATIHNLDHEKPISIQRLAEITFSEIIDIQEHLPLLLEVYPDIGEYLVEEQVLMLS